jgi:hypothetical protein
MALTVACGGGSMPSAPSGGGNDKTGGLPSGPLAFHASPLALDGIRFITPLGNLNPPGHTTPTDHIYFYFAAPDAGESPAARTMPVVAPADGTIFFVIGGQGTESKLMMRVSGNYIYYLDHVVPDVPVDPGTTVTTGQHLGRTGSAYGIDLGVINYGVTRSILSPFRYPDETVHGDAPLQYFDEPLRSQLYAKVQRIGADLDGKFDFDRAGRLSGNWFLDAGGPTAVSFARNTYDPSEVRIAFGGVPLTGVFAIAPGEPAPEDVSTTSGLVKYTLTSARTGPPANPPPPTGTLLVQMVSDSSIQLEVFVGSFTASAFTSHARTFMR